MIKIRTETIKIQTETKIVNYENFDEILFSFQYS